VVVVGVTVKVMELARMKQQRPEIIRDTGRV
jgi:hypothetical protein